MKKALLLFVIAIFTIFKAQSQDLSISLNTPDTTICNRDSVIVRFDIDNMSNGDTIVFLSYTLNNGTPINLGNYPDTLSSFPITLSDTLLLTSIRDSISVKIFIDSSKGGSGNISQINDTISLTIVNIPQAIAGTPSLSINLICENDSSNLKLTGYNDSIVWQTSSDSMTWTTDASLSGDSLWIQAISGGGIQYFRAIVGNSTCGTDTSTGIRLTSQQFTNAGTPTLSSSAICETDSALLRLTAYFGTLTKWEVSTDFGTTWNNANINSDSSYIKNLVGGTGYLYRAIVDSGVCGMDTSVSISIASERAPIAGPLSSITPAGNNVCLGSGKIISFDTTSANGHFGNIIRWEFDDGNGYIAISSSTNPVQTFTNIIKSTSYRMVVGTTVNCPEVFSDTVDITVVPPPTPGTISGPSTLCATNNDTLFLSGRSNGNVVRWERDGIVITNTSDTLPIMGLAQGTYDFKAFVSNGVCPIDSTLAFTVNVVANSIGGMISLSKDTVCAFDMNIPNTDDSVQLRLMGHTGNVVSWERSVNRNAGYSIIGSPMQDSISEFNNSQDYYYYARVQVPGCPVTFSDTVFVKAMLAPIGGTATALLGRVCAAGTDSVILTGHRGNIIQWDEILNSGTTVNQFPSITNDTTSWLISNTTQFRAILSNGGYCPNDTSTLATVVVIPRIVGGNIMVPDDSVCLGSNRDTLILQGDTGTFKQWERSTDGINFTSVNDFDSAYIHLNITQVEYFRVLVRAPGCMYDVYSDTVSITPYTPPLSIVVKDTNEICQGDSVTLVPTTGYQRYQWNTSATTDSITVYTSNRYKVTITDFRGCMNTDSVDIIVNFLPSVDAGNDASISLGDSTQLMALGASSYLWNPGSTLSDSTIFDPFAKPITTTVYYVTGTDANGCQNTDSVMVSVVRDFNFDAKNVITPNGDGFNDTWFIDNIEAYPNCTVYIMNRYGRIIYEKTGYTNTWDGTENGDPVVDGTYYYVIKCSDNSELDSGNITVLRQN